MYSYDPNYFQTYVPHIGDNEQLRSPQQIAYARVHEHFVLHQKKTHALVTLPTGVGKTGLMGLLPYGICNGRTLIITPQLVIKDSVAESLDPDYPGNFWLKYGVFERVDELPVLIEYDRDTKDEILTLSNIAVVNIQKMQARLANSLINRVSPDFFDMIIVDEAHHSTADTWLDVLHYFSHAKVIKLTGTPYRSDGKPLIGELVYNYRLSAAMANGYVKSLRNFVYIPEKLMLTMDDDDSREYTLDEIESLGLRDREWISRTVAYSIDCSRSVVEKSIELLEDKKLHSNGLPLKIIAVACSIKHAMMIKILYEELGYKATVVHSELAKEDKRKALSDVENHRVEIVINVAMLGEGYDHKYLAVGAIFRPFRNQLPYEQFIGRILRVIPPEENPTSSDNIGEVVSHKELDLEDLWGYYKREIEEADIIKSLDDLELGDDGVTVEGKGHKHDTSFGEAKEVGVGSVTVDAYLNTELIKRRQAEESIELGKIAELQRILGVSAEEARKFLQQSQAKSLLKRPDIYLRMKKGTIDNRIKQDIVPRMLAEYEIPKDSRSLAQCTRFFGKQYGWISQKTTNDNAAMLAIYITNVLNDIIGAKRARWTISDWDLAEKKLDEIEEYVSRVLEDFANS